MKSPKNTPPAAEPAWVQLTIDRLDAVEAGIAEVRSDLDRLREIIPHLSPRELR